MRVITLIMISFLFGQTVFAQKEYIDPAKKGKRPLLESGSSKEVKETNSLDAKKSESNSITTQYCACENSMRLTEQAAQMHQRMYRDGHVELEEVLRRKYSDKASEKKQLLGKFVNGLELDTSEIECEVIRVKTTRMKVLISQIDELDEVCKFEEIKRKKY